MGRGVGRGGRVDMKQGGGETGRRGGGQWGGGDWEGAIGIGRQGWEMERGMTGRGRWGGWQWGERGKRGQGHRMPVWNEVTDFSNCLPVQRGVSQVDDNSSGFMVK